jgi:hypothetical protein
MKNAITNGVSMTLYKRPRLTAEGTIKAATCLRKEESKVKGSKDGVNRLSESIKANVQGNVITEKYIQRTYKCGEMALSADT